MHALNSTVAEYDGTLCPDSYLHGVITYLLSYIAG
jgi:hypothetical protein